jgi:7-cyano-7-deazaguanine tRNA-ribosyltransferase
MFEMVDRDAGGRIGIFKVNNKTITTPTIMPVINPSKMIIEPKQIKKEFGADIIITNSYIISNNKETREEALSKGLHKMLGWKGPIYTDSGTFQMYSQKIKDINQEEILEFQQMIGSEIITPVDMFTLPTDKKTEASKKLKETIKRIKRAREFISDSMLVGPLQGGSYLDLRKQASKEMNNTNVDIHAIGGIVPYMEQYRYKELCDIVMTCKTHLAPNKPVHAFGAGHPMMFSLLTALGVDLFDSAMYALAAKREAYLTTNGTHNLHQLEEFPCSCPVCTKYTPKELFTFEKDYREQLLARHNLHVTFSELKTIRQAIREDSLWELVQQRARAHPLLLEALQHTLKSYNKHLVKLDNVSKKSAFMYLGKESEYRPEVIRAKQWMKRVVSKQKFKRKPFGSVPAGLRNTYPFSQSVIPEEGDIRVKVKPEQIFSATIDYQFGKGASKKFKRTNIESSRKTGRLRRIWKNKQLLGTMRTYDNFFVPTVLGAKILKDFIKKVTVLDDAVPYVSKGKSVFAKFVSKADDIQPGEEIAIYNKQKELIATGRAKMNRAEMRSFSRGIAVDVRSTV